MIRTLPRRPRLAGVLVAVALAGCAHAERPFRIEPLRPIAELRSEALAAEPPVETGRREADLVEIVTLDPTIRLDVRYATADNFLGTAVYTQARAFLQRPAANALVRAHRALREQGFGILVHDGYRPWHVTKIFWEATPDAQRDFVADPSQGSRHNRGAAVDVSLYDLRTGEPVTMPSGYDAFTPSAAADYPGGTTAQRQRRDLLRRAMEAEGFTVLSNEWWHFDYEGWELYPILDVPFEELTPASASTE